MIREHFSNPRFNERPLASLPRRLRRSIIVGVAAVCCGCSGDQACSVSGTASLAQKPIPDGTIRLSPINSASVSGASTNIENGHFRIVESQGMLAGQYRVAVWAVRKTGKTAPSHEAVAGKTSASTAVEEQYIPERYNRLSELMIDLKPGENSIELNLEP